MNACMKSTEPHATLTKMPIDYLAKRPRAVCDTECFPNLWAIGFKDIETKRIKKLYQTDDQPLDRAAVAKIMRYYRIHTFNGIKYDLPMIMLAMSGASCADLKRANDLLIPEKGSGVAAVMWWQFYDQFDLSIPDFVDHIDLMEVAPSAAQRASLKKYAGMMHSRTMMESMHDFDKPLDAHGIKDTLDYLDNDLQITEELTEELTEKLDIRSHISVAIGVDVRSKSDAQIGEAIMKARVEKRMGGKKLYKSDIVRGGFKYEAPAYIEFQQPMMQGIFSRLMRAVFMVKGDGYVELPEMFGKPKKKTEDEESVGDLEGGAEIVIGGNVYKMGIGGLHSQEKAISHYEDDDHDLVDVDVTGYYPNLIVFSGREPDTMRGHFQPVFKGIKVAREVDKAAGRVVEAETGKIVTNGLFGKTGSPFSIVYAPRLMIQTTVTGQLSLLMLIEEFTMRGWQVCSANTDGIVVKVPKKDRGMFKSVIFDWECAAGLSMEYTYYRSTHSQSVNSYVAFKKGKGGSIEVKRKGRFAPSGRGIKASFGLKKTPDCEISYDAVVAFLLDGTSIESTVRNCQDIRKFVTIRAVKGGAADQDGEWIGKVVRYYRSTDVTGNLVYLSNGNKVQRSNGAQPCMTLPDELPPDIDYEFYERETYAILDECGVAVEDPSMSKRRGTYYGRMEDQKTLHLINARTGVACCGAARKSRRDLWVEYKTLPAGERFCGKCKKEDL